MSHLLDSLACTACCQTRSKYVGLKCDMGHFFCSVEGRGCVEAMVDAQIHSIRFQQGQVLCPVCSSVIPLSVVGLHVTQGKWRHLCSVVSDAKKISNNDDRDKVADATPSIDAKVATIARQVRNKTLNLMCPHCQTVYADFDGCMAIMCESCKKWFCGYCHAPFPDSNLSHQHVLSCSMNDNKTHWANPDELRKGQTKYGTTKLKEVLRRHKKADQDAALLELQKDLEDLGIHRETLLER